MSYQDLRDLVSKIQLFKDKSLMKKEEDRQDLIDEICGIIKFEEFTQGKRVFRFGDYGDKFYIICRGTVSVHVPIKVSAEKIESCKSLSSFCSTNEEISSSRSHS